MTTFGLTTTGFVPKTVTDIRSDLETALRNAFGASIALGDKSVFGQINGIMADAFGDLWELGDALFTMLDPDGASGVALEAVSAITGTLRVEASDSTVTLTLTGTPATVIPQGETVAATSTGVRFATTDATTIVLLDSWVALHSYVIDDRVTNSSRAYVCIAPGASASSGGPTSNAPDITDGTVHWQYLGDGTGAVDQLSASVVAGDVVAVAGDITTIVTPVGGWSSVLNLLDATPGQDTQTDEQLRISRSEELAGDGGSTPDALRAALIEIRGVISVTVFNNNTDLTDANGVPPHAVECLVRTPDGTLDQTIVNVIGNEIADGIATHGSTSGTFTDSEGNPQTINFSHPTNDDIYADVTLTYDVELYPSDGDAEVKAAIVAFGDGFATGRDAVASSVGAQGFTVAGVLDVMQVLLYTDVIGTPVAWTTTHSYVATPGAPSVVTNDGGRCYVCTIAGTSAGSGGPTGTGTAIVDGSVTWRFLGAPIAIDVRSLAVFDTSRINVHSSAATP